MDQDSLSRPSLADFIKREAQRAAEQAASQESSFSAISQTIGPLQWDWPQWLPRGVLIMLAGHLGSGKSALALRICASYLSGWPWPDGSPFNAAPGQAPTRDAPTRDAPNGDSPNGDVLWCESESGHVVNLSRARDWALPLPAIRMLLTGHRDYHCQDPEHRAALHKLLRDPAIRLVVVDSLLGALAGQTNHTLMNKAVLYFAALARCSGIPILLIHHLRKPGSLDPTSVSIKHLYGSTLVAQYTRLIWALESPRPETDNLARLSVIKSNLAAPPPPLGLRIDAQGVSAHPLSAAASLHSPLESAKTFLLENLAAGSLTAGEIKRRYLDAGHHRTTIFQAKRQLRIRSHKSSGVWHWALPDSPTETESQASPTTLEPLNACNPLLEENTHV